MDLYVKRKPEEKLWENIFAEQKNMPEALKMHWSFLKRSFSASFNNFGALEIVGTEALTNDKFEILHRFGKVFDNSYTRFNDLKKPKPRPGRPLNRPLWTGSGERSPAWETPRIWTGSLRWSGMNWPYWEYHSYDAVYLSWMNHRSSSIRFFLHRKAKPLLLFICPMIIQAKQGWSWNIGKKICLHWLLEWYWFSWFGHYAGWTAYLYILWSVPGHYSARRVLPALFSVPARNAVCGQHRPTGRRRNQLNPVRCWCIFYRLCPVRRLQ